MSITYTLVSADAAGPASTGRESITGDGRFVLYYSNSVLTLADLQAGTTQTVTPSLPPNGQGGLGLSGDGRYVTYLNGTSINIWDRLGQSTTTFAVAGLFASDVSADSNHIYVSASAFNLATQKTDWMLESIDIHSGAINIAYQTEANPVRYEGGDYAIISGLIDTGSWRLDLNSGITTEIVAPGTGALSISLSGDGRYAVFSSDHAFVSSDTNGTQDVYLRNLTTGAFSLISSAVSGAAGNGASFAPTISANGNIVAFVTEASNIAAGAGAVSHHLMVTNLATGITLDAGDIGAGSVADISDDGFAISIETGKSLVAADLDAASDVYVMSILPSTIAMGPVAGDNYVNATEIAGPITVSGTSDAIGRLVQVAAPNGTFQSTHVDAAGNWSVTFNNLSAVADGSHAFTAYTTDDTGFSRSASTNVVFDKTPPSLILYAVAGDNIIARREASEVVIDGSSDALGRVVSLSIDQHAIGVAQVSQTGDWSFVFDGTGLTDGQHEIEFSVTDLAGNVTSQSIYFDKASPPNAAPSFFVDGGFIITPLEAQAGGKSVSIMSDGRIALAGVAYSYAAPTGVNYDFALVRYNADGSLDASLDGDGKLTTDFGSTPTRISMDELSGTALQADGKTILAGFSYILHYNDPGFRNGDMTDLGFALARYGADGLDSSFGTGGLVKTPFGGGSGASAVVMDGDKIVAGGFVWNAATTEQDAALVRYLADGSLDPTFGNGGIVTRDFGSLGGTGEYVQSISVQPDGKIVVGVSTSIYNQSKFVLARYNSDGSFDAILNDTGTGSSGEAVVVQPDGKILVGGFSPVHPEGDAYALQQFTITRYNTNGTLDTTFGDAGVVQTQVGDTSHGLSLRLQSDGKIVLGGDSGSADGVSFDFAIARYNTDGTLDLQFGGVNSLGNAVHYTAGGPAVVLDAAAAIYDPELAALGGGTGNYGGASVTLARQGGANEEDVFGGSGDLMLDGSDVRLLGAIIGRVLTGPAGQLTIQFSNGTTQAQVNAALDAITYSNTSPSAAESPPVTIEWSFSDGNSGSQGTGGNKTTSGITTVEFSSPVIITTIEGGDDTINAAEAADGIVLSGTTGIGSTLKVNGETVVVDAEGGWTTTIEPPATDGPLVVTAIATDSSGHAENATRTLTLDRVASVAITAIEGGDDSISASEAAGGVDISGTAEIGATLTVNGASVAVNSTGAWTTTVDTPADGGQFLVTAVVTDAAGNIATTERNLTVTSNLNHAPVAPATSAISTDEDTASIAVQIGASDPDGDSLTYSTKAGAGPAAGVLSFAGGSFIYTPSNNANGTDAFTIVIDDGRGGTAEQVVTVTVNPVNDAPVGAPTAALPGGTEDVPYSVTFAGLLAGFTDPDSDALSVAGLTASNGTVVDTATGYTITPAADFNGPVTLTYTVSDGHGGTLAGQKLTYSLAPAPDDATINGTSTGNVTEDAAPGTTGGVLTVVDPDAGEGVFRTPASLAATYGDFAFNATTGAWSYTLDNARVATQALGASSTVHDTLAVTSSDGTATRLIDVTINGANEAAVIGTPTVAGVIEDTNVVAGELLASGLISISDPDQGEAAFNTAVTGAAGNIGSLNLSASGSYTYKVLNSAVQFLGAGEAKVDTFTVTSLDGTARTVSFTVNGQNDAAVIGTPTLAGVASNLSFGTTVAAGTISILDPDQGQAAFRTTVTGAVGNLGSLVIAAGGGYTYTVANVDILPFGAGETKVDTFTVTALDGTTKAVDFTITGLNNAPVVSGAANLGTAVGGAPLIISESQLLSTVTDADRNDVLHVVNLTVAASSGTLLDNNNGTWTFTPAAAAANTVVNFSYGVTDGHVATPVADAATLSISAASEIIGQPGQMTVNGTGGSDRIVIGPTNVFANAGAGDDSIALTPAAGVAVHILNGGPGSDTLDLSGTTTSNTINLTTGIGYGSQIGLAILSSIENVTGGSGGDTLTGNGSANRLDGGAGQDTIRGGGGSDAITGGAGNDTVTGGAGGDTFVFRPGFGSDVITDFQVGGATASAVHDVLDLHGLGFTSIADVLNHTDAGASALIHAGTDTITLQGVTKAQLAAHQFDILL